MKTYSSILLAWIVGLVVSPAAPDREIVPEPAVVAVSTGAEAQFQQARDLLMGQGVPKDEKKAFELMMSAANQGHPDAIGGIGYFHSRGIVVEKDDAAAAGWFRKGSEKGSAKAQLNLGKLLLDGKGGGTETDPEKLRAEGLAWVRKAADQKLADAASTYGIILYQAGYGQPRDPSAAAPYLKLAAEQGVVDAQNTLGYMYTSGDGVPYDPAVAGEWLKKAALQGHVKAQANYGELLDPMAADRVTGVEAVAWLLVASEKGDVGAKKVLQDHVPALKAGELELARTRAAELRKTIVVRK
ncbi:MAG: tetratricopeptide repeat protein [Verrucomicrobiota bacterium]